MRETGTQAKAAKEAGVSVERFRRFLYDRKLAKRESGKWQFTDNRLRKMTIISDGQSRRIRLTGFDDASFNGRYLAAVSAFIRTNDPAFLTDFAGLSVRDSKGKLHPCETNPNALYRLIAADDEPFEVYYKLVTN